MISYYLQTKESRFYDPMMPHEVEALMIEASEIGATTDLVTPYVTRISLENEEDAFLVLGDTDGDVKRHMEDAMISLSENPTMALENQTIGGLFHKENRRHIRQWVIRVEGRKIAEFEEDKENLARAYIKNFSDGSEDLDIAG